MSNIAVKLSMQLASQVGLECLLYFYTLYFTDKKITQKVHRRELFETV